MADLGFELLDQLELHWQTQLRPRLDGLTDDECWWEPVAGCWSIRPRAEATTTYAAGAGERVIDWEFPEPDPPPVTTIAWRLGHVAVGVFGIRVSQHFGDGGLDYTTVEWPGTATGMLEFLDAQHASWVDHVRQLDAAALANPAGPAEGPYADRTFAALVLHLNREAIHHGAEVALLRDLYRERATLGMVTSG